MNTTSQEDPVLVTTFKGHKDTINALAFHPGLKQLASGSQDSTVHVWNLRNQSKIYRYLGHKGPINDIDFSPNGNLIASASKDETIKLWNNTIEGNSLTIKAHNAAVRSVQFSCDGQLLVSSSDDKTIKVWSVNNRKFLYSLTGHSNWVRNASFSPDCRLIASGGDDRLVKLWDTDQRQEVQSYSDHAGIIYQTKFHPDGTCLASCSHDKKIKIFDFRAKRLIQHYDAHNDAVYKVSFHPSGHYLLSSSADAKLKIWDLRKGKLAYTLYGHSGSSTATAFSYFGDYFASGGSDCSIMLWQSNFQVTGKESISQDCQDNSIKGNQSIQTKSFTQKSKKCKVEKDQQQIEPGQSYIDQQTKQFSQNKENLSGKNNQINLLYSGTDKSIHNINEWNTEQKGQEQAVLQRMTQPQQQEYKVPNEVKTSLDKIFNQLDFITKTLQILQGRVEQNEEQIQRLNLVIHQDLEKQSGLADQIFNIQELEKVGINKEAETKLFYPAPNNQ